MTGWGTNHWSWGEGLKRWARRWLQKRYNIFYYYVNYEPKKGHRRGERWADWECGVNDINWGLRESADEGQVPRHELSVVGDGFGGIRL